MERCPHCKSKDFKKKGLVKRSRETRQEYHCNNCAKHFSHRLDIRYPLIRGWLRSVELATYRKVEAEISFMLKKRGVE